MRVDSRSNETKGTSRIRAKILWLSVLWIVPWIIFGPSAQAEILYDEEGIQLHGTARIVTRNAATCHVLEDKYSEAEYEELKANDGQPLHVWRLDYSVHNRTGRALSYLRAGFDIESEWPPCTNWSWEGQGPGQYPGHVLWADQPFRPITAPDGMAADEVMEEELYLIVFHTDEPSFERWSTHFTFGEAEGGGQRPEPPSEISGSSSRPPQPASGSSLPAEVMLDEYLMEAEMLSGEKDHKGALEAMARIVALQKEHRLTLPEEFPFKYAQTALAAGSYQAAVDAATQYLAKAGRGSKHYREALALRVKSRRGLRAPAAARAGAVAAGPNSAGGSTPGADARGGRRVQPQVRERLPYEPEMVEIPGGSFRMGCVSGLDCRDEEQPVHAVRVATFALSKFEVTFEEYDRFTSATGRARVDDEGWGRGRRPVINVSWEDAVAYTRWLSQQTGERYRLPSEAEWEYAARAGSVTKYNWGNEIGRNRANCDGCGSRWDGRTTAPVGSFPPNRWGVHDMHGNVSEWVQDCGNDNYQGAPSDGSAWLSGNCSERIVRGGSWFFNPWHQRSALRVWIFATVWNRGIGFRVARTITP